MWVVVRLYAQTTGTDPAAWATYGPLGLFCLVLIGVAWYFIRRESARADRWEAIALKLIEANQTALKSQDSAHLSMAVLEDVLKLALAQEKKPR